MSETEHGRGSGPSEEPLTPPDTRAPSHAERAFTLVASRSVGTLATVAKEPAGYPYGSFVTYAMHDASPVFLVSRLAVHTQHLEADPRASLLVAEDGEADPLANGRVTLVGEVRRVGGKAEVQSVRAAYLATHPGAAYYVDFTDFGFFRLEISAIRYIGGYGRMSWVEPGAWREATPDPLAAHAAGILAHMNEDHAAALAAYARAFTRARDAEEAVMTAIDRYGFEISVTTPDGKRPARLAFDAPIGTPEDARAALVGLVKRAREALAERDL
jgi:putative heme iron utilization protein